MNQPVTPAPPQIPYGCICAYTWHPYKPGWLARNGPVLACPADHAAVDGLEAS